MILYTDGGCRGNSTKTPVDERIVRYAVSKEDAEIISDIISIGGSNNIAELLGVFEALKYAKANKISSLIIRTDSKNNFAWVLGKKVGKNINDRRRVFKIKKEINELRKEIHLELEFVPREKNIAGIYLENTPMVYSV